ncbi:MAG: hypothetical protein H0X46_06655 [Bacteroidetes bacterium]|nr:hypothetical protein [Bacteroidota bacterium]
MNIKQFQYCLSGTLSLIAFTVYSQPNGNQSNQAVVTIVGNAPADNLGNTFNNDPNDFINSNPYTENNEPPVQQQMTSQNIEPTLENGFHIRFELNSQKTEDQILSSSLTASSSTGTSSSGGGASVGRTKKRTVTLAERTFNAKKRLKSWLPKRKKRYHPHLCGRF